MQCNFSCSNLSGKVYIQSDIIFVSDCTLRWSAKDLTADVVCTCYVVMRTVNNDNKCIANEPARYRRVGGN